MTGLVYYVLDATRLAQYLKIGFTTDLRKRVTELQGITGCAQPPLVLAVEEGSLTLERERHHEYAELRSHGEWFQYEDPLRKYVSTLEHPFAYLLDRPHLWRWTGGWGPFSMQASGQKPWGRVGAEESSPPLPPVEF
jgi:hypothetical protein